MQIDKIVELRQHGIATVWNSILLKIARAHVRRHDVQASANATCRPVHDAPRSQLGLLLKGCSRVSLKLRVATLPLRAIEMK